MYSTLTPLPATAWIPPNSLVKLVEAGTSALPAPPGGSPWVLIPITPIRLIVFLFRGRTCCAFFNKTIPSRATSIATSTVRLQPQIISYEAIKDAKQRVLQNLSGSGEASVVEIVTDTALSFALASAAIGDLETEGKVTVKMDEGFKWVELKK
jgi:hypothetical protein